MRRILVPAVLAVALLAGNASNASAFGHVKSLFGGGNSGCDTACEPVCGCEPVCEPVCGCEIVVEPACCTPKTGLLHKLFHHHKSSCDTGCCEVAAPVCYEPVCEPACGFEPTCCDSKPCRPFGGFFARMFEKKHCCDSACEPTCGCETTFACEPTCGIEAPCGCH